MIDLLIVGIIFLVVYGLRKLWVYCLDLPDKAYIEGVAYGELQHKKSIARVQGEVDELYDALRAVAGDIHLPETASVQHARSLIRNENR